MEVVNALGRRKRAVARVFVSEGTGCIHPCKQSFRAKIVACPFYASKRTDRAKNMS